MAKPKSFLFIGLILMTSYANSYDCRFIPYSFSRWLQIYWSVVVLSQRILTLFRHLGLGQSFPCALTWPMWIYVIS